jgi:Tol biopolymer transport system component
VGGAVRLAPDGVLSNLAKGLGRWALGLGLVTFSACGGGPSPEQEAAAAARQSDAPVTAGEGPVLPGAVPAPAAVPAASGPVPQTAQPFQSVTAGTLAFQSDVAGRPKLFTVDLASGQVRQITHGAEWRDESPRWSPDGQFIAFSSNRAHYGPQPEQGTPDFDVYVMRADGSEVRRLTVDPGNDADAAWLPDGQSLVFSSDRASRGDLYRVRLADGHTDRLTTNFVGRAIMPAVSPDGRTVAFAAQTLRIGEFWNFQVHLLDLSTGQTSPVPASGGACWPAWSPDGRTLYNVQLDREPSSVQRRDLGSGEVAIAHASPTLWSYYPRVSPDGQWLVVSLSPQHHDGENWDLALVSTSDPGRRVPLTTGPGNDRLADWKPR